MSFILNYPVATPTLTVTLGDPVLGNIRRVETGAIYRKSISGEVRGAYDSTWPTVYRNVYTFTSLRDNDSSSTLYLLRDFLETSAGLQIKITDHNAEVWHGYIISPVNEIVTIRDECSYDVGFEFMGDLQP